MKNVPLLMIGASLIGTLTLVVITGQVYPELLGQVAALGSFSWIIASTLILAFHFRNKRRKVKEEPIRQKIAELKSKGVDLHLEAEEALTGHDVNKVKGSIRNTIIFVFLAGGIGTSLVYFLSEGFLPIIVLCVAMLFLIIIAYSSISSMQGILKSNKKIIVRGIITNERQQEVGVGRGRKINYFKTIGNHELQVDVNVNKRYKLGQAVEIHYALNGKMIPYIFEDKLLLEGVIPA